MVKHILTYEEDRSRGTLGFRIEGTKINPEAYNMATDGLLVAHDLIEHVNGLKQIGTIGDELEALGAIWFVRGQWGELRRDNIGSASSVEQNIASDVINMGRSIVTKSTKYHKKVPNVKINGSDWLDTFKEIIQLSKLGLIGELEGEEWTQADLEQYLSDTLKFMIAGCKKAHAKYRVIGGAVRANNLFWNIAEAVDGALKQAEFQGQQFALYVNKMKGEAWYKETTDYSY